jgi:hypothetical protein
MPMPSLGRRIAGLGLVAGMLLGQPAARGAGIDPHALYERRCSRCHEPHSADLAEASLRLADGQVIGIDSGREVGALLQHHRGLSMASDQIDALVDHFAAILTTDRLYRRKCIICHDPAVTLARSRLILRDGVLLGRYDGRDIEAFLAGHGRLTEPEIAVISAMLRRQLASAPGQTTP